MSKSVADAQPPKADDAGESDAERLAALKHANALSKKRWEVRESQKAARQKALIEEYKERAAKKCERERAERRRRLDDLQARSVSTAAVSLEPSAEDDEYAELMRMYGNRIRVHVPKKPRVPKIVRKIDALKSFREGIAEAVKRNNEEAEEGVRKSKRNKASVKGSVSQLPPLKESSRSVMPKKEMLRRKQQDMMKGSEVVFYKEQMKAHMNRILAAVELTFGGNSVQEWKNKCSGLAKPKAIAKRMPAELTPITPSA
eukprot:TRINITY_DN14320_c0_g1_i1.p1 TRINITY_DN14320_c0_g1~~TRINITY_DN14320_c0_g1_i1.p1  ORF type:complete len:258 (-),score=68.29 TRINITY_DN14320_c0_g1_i1:194-967(-)